MEHIYFMSTNQIWSYLWCTYARHLVQRRVAVCKLGGAAEAEAPCP